MGSARHTIRHKGFDIEIFERDLNGAESDFYVCFPCETCRGTGAPRAGEECELCGGSGTKEEVNVLLEHDAGRGISIYKCRKCEDCPTCKRPLECIHIELIVKAIDESLRLKLKT